MAKVNITVRHVKLPEKFKKFAIIKVEKLNRFFDHINRIDVIFTYDSKFYNAEMIIIGSHRLTLVAHASSSDPLSAIETVVNKMERQLIKLKEKLRDHHTKKFQTTVIKSPRGIIKSLEDGDTSYSEALQ